MKGRGTVKQRGRSRRKAILKANRLGVPAVVAVKARASRKIIVVLCLVWGSLASATTYYVSSGTGNDANSGTSSGAAWQTVAKGNAQSFVSGEWDLSKEGGLLLKGGSGASSCGG